MSEAQASRSEKRYLIFSLGKEQFGVPLLQVKEVLGATETTPVPYTPPHFKGIMNLRGHVISIIDLRLKFKISKGVGGPETAVVILDLHPLSIGVVVDSVDSVITLSDADIAETPVVESSIDPDYISGVARRESRLILLLDIEKSLSIEELKALRKQTDNQAA